MYQRVATSHVHPLIQITSLSVAIPSIDAVNPEEKCTKRRTIQPDEIVTYCGPNSFIIHLDTGLIMQVLDGAGTVRVIARGPMMVPANINAHLNTDGRKTGGNV